MAELTAMTGPKIIPAAPLTKQGVDNLLPNHDQRNFVSYVSKTFESLRTQALDVLTRDDGLPTVKIGCWKYYSEYKNEITSGIAGLKFSTASLSELMILADLVCVDDAQKNVFLSSTLLAQDIDKASSAGINLPVEVISYCKAKFGIVPDKKARPFENSLNVEDVYKLMEADTLLVIADSHRALDAQENALRKAVMCINFPNLRQEAMGRFCLLGGNQVTPPFNLTRDVSHYPAMGVGMAEHVGNLSR